MTGESKCCWCTKPIEYAEFNEYDGVHGSCYWSWLKNFYRHNPKARPE